MTETEPIDDIFPRIIAQYSERPRGWRVLSTARNDMLIIGPQSAFQLKIVPVGPREVTGAGIEIENPTRTLKGIRRSPEFGLRPLHESDLETMTRSLGNPEMVRSHLRSVISRAPVSTKELEAQSVSHLLSGPVLTRPDLDSLGPEILSTRKVLEDTAMEVFRKKFPMRSGFYM